MKRKIAVALILAVMLISTQAVFAGSLEIVKTVPGHGETGKQPSNVAVKICFNQKMDNVNNDDANAKLITIENPDGEAQEFKIIHHEKYQDEIWCVLTGSDLKTNTEYKVTVKSGIVSSDGNTLGSDYVFTFKTRNTKLDNGISVGLSIGMMVVMVVATMRSAKKQEEEKNVQKKVVTTEKIAQANPYKLAKAQGISVDEAKALIAKDQAKLDKKKAVSKRTQEKYEAKMAKREAEIQRRLQEIHDASVYKVKTKGSVLEHGYKLPKSLEKKFKAQAKKAKK